MLHGVKNALKFAAYGTSASFGVFFIVTRKNVFVSLDATDPIFRHRLFGELNPLDNPSLHDLCIRRVPISNIRSDLIQKEGKLVEAFCAGVWGGWGYRLQRAVLAKLHHDASTQSQLWSPEELLTSEYNVGTLVTDHFEVVEKTPETILLRSGDSPRNQAVREVDGLFGISAVAKPEQGVVEFGLKTCFFQGLGKTHSRPVPAPIEWLHRQYVKLLMETAVHNVLCP
ncbi:hypothetical protein BJX64DRAFT_294106 [Aspergillus heterothallicus]